MLPQRTRIRRGSANRYHLLVIPPQVHLEDPGPLDIRVKEPPVPLLEGRISGLRQGFGVRGSQERRSCIQRVKSVRIFNVGGTRFSCSTDP